MSNETNELVVEERLAVREVKLLTECEEVIKTDIKAFMRVGAALATIRNERLYRSDFLSFEEYLAAKWDMKKRYAEYLVEANEVVEKLKELLPGTSVLGCTIVHTESGAPSQSNIEDFLPKNEAQARALTQYIENPDKMLQVWTSALRTAPNGKITAKHVEKAADLAATGEKKEKIKQTRDKVDQEKRFTPEFKAAFNALWAEIQKEVLSKYATTSKEAIAQHARGILNIVGE